MGIRKRTALIATGAAVLLAGGGGIAAWKVHEHREQEAFIAEQYAILESEKAALMPGEDLDDELAGRECAEEHSNFAYERVNVTQNDWNAEIFLFSAKDASGSYYGVKCVASWEDDQWVVEAR